MCTIVLLHRVHPRWPVVIAANRDEYYSRAASAPEVLTRDPVPVLGGRDARHAGTWMGATQRGFFVGLTNQRTLRPADASRRSRGEVVLEALRRGSREAVDELTCTLAGVGCLVLSRPRITGDGYYEASLQDPEGNLLELVA